LRWKFHQNATIPVLEWALWKKIGARRAGAFIAQMADRGGNAFSCGWSCMHVPTGSGL
jgi:hypothetical protein